MRKHLRAALLGRTEDLAQSSKSITSKRIIKTYVLNSSCRTPTTRTYRASWALFSCSPNSTKLQDGSQNQTVRERRWIKTRLTFCDSGRSASKICSSTCVVSWAEEQLRNAVNRRANTCHCSLPVRTAWMAALMTGSASWSACCESWPDNLVRCGRHSTSWFWKKKIINNPTLLHFGLPWKLFEPRIDYLSVIWTMDIWIWFKPIYK